MGKGTLTPLNAVPLFWRVHDIDGERRVMIRESGASIFARIEAGIAKFRWHVRGSSRAFDALLRTARVQLCLDARALGRHLFRAREIVVLRVHAGEHCVAARLEDGLEGLRSRRRRIDVAHEVLQQVPHDLHRRGIVVDRGRRIARFGIMTGEHRRVGRGEPLGEPARERARGGIGLSTGQPQIGGRAARLEVGGLILHPAFRGHKLYALEMSTAAGSPTPGTGAIVRVNRHGPPTTVVSGLTFPTGMTVGPDGAFYVSNKGFGFGAGQGQVLRIKI